MWVEILQSWGCYLVSFIKVCWKSLNSHKLALFVNCVLLRLVLPFKWRSDHPHWFTLFWSPHCFSLSRFPPLLVTSISITPLVDSSLSMLNPALWVPGKGSYLLINVIHTLRSTAAIFNNFICWVFIWLCHCCRMLFFQRLLTLEAADLYSCCLFAEFFNSWFRKDSWPAQVWLNRF